MKTGTKSVLFGVHAFWWHPLTVWLAWVKLYRTLPSFWETVAIIVHDWGYWGCDRMDDKVGQDHPLWGAGFIWCLYRWTHKKGPFVNYLKAQDLARLVAFHSSHLAKKHGSGPSALCAPDKLSIEFEPEWFYLLRARLSGEITEYVANSPPPEMTPSEWFNWYRQKTIEKYAGIPLDY